MTAVTRRRLTLLAMCISQAMILLDITIVNIALPSIQRELSMSPGRLEWVVSAYALSLAAFIPFGGTLGDRYGRKRLFIIGMLVFTVGSIGCALSMADTALIGARVIEGVGGAVMSALTLSILTETYPPETRAGAIGTWAAIAGLGFGAGPVVGGILLGFFGWSSIFWVNVPLALAGLLLTVIAVHESRDPVPRRLDVPGVLASALGLLALTFGLIESSTYHWGSPIVAAPLGIGVASLVLFGLWENRTPSPMLPPSLLRARSFTIGCSVYLLVYLALTGVMFYVTLLYQNVDGWSALRTGLSWLSMNIPVPGHGPALGSSSPAPLQHDRRHGRLFRRRQRDPGSERDHAVHAVRTGWSGVCPPRCAATARWFPESPTSPCETSRGCLGCRLGHPELGSPGRHVGRAGRAGRHRGQCGRVRLGHQDGWIPGVGSCRGGRAGSTRRRRADRNGNACPGVRLPGSGGAVVRPRLPAGHDDGSGRGVRGRCLHRDRPGAAFPRRGDR